MMGGLGAHEYMAPCAAGENDVALRTPATPPTWRSQARAGPGGRPARAATPPSRWRRPTRRRVQVSELLGVPPAALIKAIPVDAEGRGPVLALVRGDHRLNEISCRTRWGGDPGRRGGRGPRGLRRRARLHRPVGARVEVVADEALRGLRGLVAGGNEPDIHLPGSSPAVTSPHLGRHPQRRGGRSLPGRRHIRIEPAIEVGNIFKLGTRYSEPLGATYLDEKGAEHPIVMGSYGIGPARIVAAAVEQFADEQGSPGRGRWRRSTPSWCSARRGRSRARWPSGSTRSCARPASTCSTTTGRPAPARSSPTRSSWAAPCGSRPAGRAWRPAVSTPRSAAAARSDRSRSRTRPTPPRAVAEPPLRQPGAHAPGAEAGGSARCAGFRVPPRPLPAYQAPAAGPRPFRSSAARDPPPAAASPVDDSQRDRLRQAGAAAAGADGCALVRRRPRHRHRSLGGRRLGRLPRRDGGADHGPVQPPRDLARPAHRQAAGHLGRRRDVALRAAAALGARGPGRARGLHAAPDPGGTPARDRSQGQHAGPVGNMADHGGPRTRDDGRRGCRRRCCTSAWE